MLRAIFFATACCAMLGSCDVRKKDKQAQLPAVKQEVKDPTTVQIIDSVYDFGNTTEGEVVQYSYRFKNTGNKPLVVSNVSASCGCTVPEKPEKPIMPGEVGFILVKFNSDKRPGEAHKTITVSSNANPPFPELLLKGTVVGKDKD
ncbi:MAG: DUF1573 domain-containing protein [Ferruginibacter sp.]|nr:DUF1573 domain-containing protein [Ferruginibacter sp.]